MGQSGQYIVSDELEVLQMVSKADNRRCVNKDAGLQGATSVEKGMKHSL